MVDWNQELLESIVIGIIFAFLLAKLISTLLSFKQDNLSITRLRNQLDTIPEDAASHWPDSPTDCDTAEQSEAEWLISDQGSSSDDDWEGLLENSELEEAFDAASVFVAMSAADGNSAKVSTDNKLLLYALYKIATEGPCSIPQPSALKMTARAKWQAWQQLGTMPSQEAMMKYIDVVTELYPTWTAGSAVGKGPDGDTQNANSQDAQMGPVFSSFMYDEEPGTEMKMDNIHVCARDGDVDNLLECIRTGASVNSKDSEGRTPLHWAVDRGHLNLVEALVTQNADVNAKDNEGQTPLHYAVVCDMETIAEFLVEQKADTSIEDNDGNSPPDICESDWPWIKHGTKCVDRY